MIAYKILEKRDGAYFSPVMHTEWIDGKMSGEVHCFVYEEDASLYLRRAKEWFAQFPNPKLYVLVEVRVMDCKKNGSYCTAEFAEILKEVE